MQVVVKSTNECDILLLNNQIRFILDELIHSFPVVRHLDLNRTLFLPHRSKEVWEAGTTSQLKSCIKATSAMKRKKEKRKVRNDVVKS